MNTMKCIGMAMAIAGLFSAVCPARAGISNGGFETGDVTGWAASPTSLVEVTTSAHDLGQGDFGTIKPVEGNDFAILTAGPSAGVYTLLSQSFTAGVGDKLRAFRYSSTATTKCLTMTMAMPSLINLGTSSSSLQLFYSDVKTVGGDYRNRRSWVAVSTTITTAGTYELQFGVTNVGDPEAAFSSALAVDAVKLTPFREFTASVPEPGSMTLLGAASIFGLGFKAVEAAESLIGRPLSSCRHAASGRRTRPVCSVWLLTDGVSSTRMGAASRPGKASGRLPEPRAGPVRGMREEPTLPGRSSGGISWATSHAVQKTDPATASFTPGRSRGSISHQASSAQTIPCEPKDVIPNSPGSPCTTRGRCARIPRSLAPAPSDPASVRLNWMYWNRRAICEDTHGAGISSLGVCPSIRLQST